MTARIFQMAMLALVSVSASAQQIANGDFEEWTDQYAYTNLLDWTTGNWQIPGVVTTTQVPGAIGAYAAHLQTQIVDGDTAFGYILHGDFQDDIPTGGVAFSTAVDAVEGWYRCDVQPGDSALILVAIWSGGNVVSSSAHMFGGSQPVWTAFDLPVNDGVPIVPDSVVVAVASSNPFASEDIMDGSWFEVDAISLTSTTVNTPDALPNFDMEDWNDVGTEEPDDWSTFNVFLAQQGITPVTKSTMAYSGDYSVRIETFGLNGDTIPGLMTNGLLTPQGPQGGVPFIDLPTDFSAWYQYAPAGTDTARVYVLFLSNGAPAGSAYAQVTEGTSSWSLLGSPVILLMPPDTMSITVFSGNNPGSVFYLDSLTLTGITTGLAMNVADDLRLFPNPVTDRLNIALRGNTSGGAALRVFDAQGRTVSGFSTARTSVNSLTLDVAHLPVGTYWLELRDGDRLLHQPFVKR